MASVVFFALGAAMAYGGYAMDRLEIRQIHPASIPGLVPMILGVAMMVCAALLFPLVRTGSTEDEAPGTGGGSWRDLLAAAGMSLVYAVGLVGNLPYMVATAVYVAAFIVYFGRREDRRRGLAYMAFAAVFGIIVAAAIALLFRYGFLVRLP